MLYTYKITVNQYNILLTDHIYPMTGVVSSRMTPPTTTGHNNEDVNDVNHFGDFGFHSHQISFQLNTYERF